MQVCKQQLLEKDLQQGCKQQCCAAGCARGPGGRALLKIWSCALLRAFLCWCFSTQPHQNALSITLPTFPTFMQLISWTTWLQKGPTFYPGRCFAVCPAEPFTWPVNSWADPWIRSKHVSYFPHTFSTFFWKSSLPHPLQCQESFIWASMLSTLASAGSQGEIPFGCWIWEWVLQDPEIQWLAGGRRGENRRKANPF